MIAELLLLLYSIKLSIVVLLLGYMFSKTIWVCPMCKRTVPMDEGKSYPTQNHIIIRLNDCMVLLSKTKFRIAAGLACGVLLYLFATEPSYHYEPRVRIEKSWKSIVSNCGYDTYVENSFKFRYLYNLYEESNGWNLEGIFLSQ